MVVLHIDQGHLVIMRFDTGLAAQHGELRASPVDYGITADMSIENVVLVAELTGSVFGHDEEWRFSGGGRFGTWDR